MKENSKVQLPTNEMPQLPPGIYVSLTVVSATPAPKSGKTKRDATPYTMSTTAAVVGDRFAQIIEYHRSENAQVRKFVPGPVTLKARTVTSDPKNPSILRISLSEDLD